MKHSELGERRVALISGGAGGIGLAVARALAASGVAIALLDLESERLRSTGRSLAAAGFEAEIFAGDVTSESDVCAAVRSVAVRWGRLDYLITAAGILGGAFTPVEELDVALFRRILDVNVIGTFLCCRYAVPVMERTGGVIVCVASHAGVLGPSSSLPYGASKSAVYGFSRTLEHDLAPRGIRVVCVAPGSIDTPMKQENLRDRARAEGISLEEVAGRIELGSPEGVARLVAFAVSPQADHLRGLVVTR